MIVMKWETIMSWSIGTVYSKPWFWRKVRHHKAFTHINNTPLSNCCVVHCTRNRCSFSISGMNCASNIADETTSTWSRRSDRLFPALDVRFWEYERQSETGIRHQKTHENEKWEKKASKFFSTFRRKTSIDGIWVLLCSLVTGVSLYFCMDSVSLCSFRVYERFDFNEWTHGNDVIDANANIQNKRREAKCFTGDVRVTTVYARVCETNLCLFIKVFGATREKLKIEKVDK